MSRRIRMPRDLGDAISLDAVLSVMTVLLVLRVVFLVPLVNLDRMHLVAAQKDVYWQQLSDYLQSKGDTAGLEYYASAFAMDGNRILVSEGNGDTRYVESLNTDGTITVVEHRLGVGRFDAMVVKGLGAVPTFRYGSLKWSSTEQVWFTSNDSVDYGERKESLAMKKRFREWTKTMRGF